MVEAGQRIWTTYLEPEGSYSFSLAKAFLELTLVRTPPSFLSQWSDLHSSLKCSLSTPDSFLLPIQVCNLSCTSLHPPLRTQTNKGELGKTSGSLSRQETFVYRKEEALNKWLGRQAKIRSWGKAFSLSARINFGTCLWRPWSASGAAEGMKEGQGFVWKNFFS